ncbi:sporulation YhaL family protein [Metabacillus arenae]|uniref:Sporulation YhaL family protein n=1 Tax=Metabacillus arenae TaxID=2771434 RepID=A0A926S167_9BACI|nr:sporulation YhaL family protein [Metabacillus arenae]MBD1380719.1 sporulation YhaL family protein [Metabacillus arenae]
MIMLPWWVYLCIIGIIYSGYKVFTISKEEKTVDESFIEKEGQVFIERMEKERERRKQGVIEAEEQQAQKDTSIA